jgi:rSAM/selenodomain-associated transferase 1
MISELAIAVLVKTPGLSPIKTRLALSIGKEKAEEFYRLSIGAVESVLKETEQKNSGCSLFWAVAEQDGLADPLWSGFKKIFQGEGGLGERLHHVYSTLIKNYKAVILLGADCPVIQSHHLEKSAEILKEAKEKFVLGPALDGGFYLFGGRTDIPKQLWTAVPYSQDTTLAKLSEKLTPLEEVVLIEAARDVDTLEDLIALREQFPSLGTVEQKKLLDWINSEYRK